MNHNRVIIIAGPTAVGKTAVAIDVARALGTEILSADSRQCYREMNIGVARPSEAELAAVPHHFIASHSIFEPFNAAAYEQYALKVAEDVLARTGSLVVVGGTGLYIKAFCEGMDEIPFVPEEIRSELVAAYEANGLGWLQQAVAAEDPRFYAVGEVQNPHRLLRALEVQRATGRSILEFRTGRKAERSFGMVKFALELPRPDLYERINRRVDLMMDAGQEQEARGLFPHRHLPALQTVGYQELFDYFEGKSTLDQAVTDIKTHTRNYARRQLTWFRKDPGFEFLAPDAAAILKRIPSL